MYGNALGEGLNYRVIFYGKVAETDEQNVFSIYMINSGLKNSEIGKNIKILQFGELTINSEKLISSNQEFKNSVLVR
ncbi:MAG: hypothetical protein ACE5GR_01515 [Nitrosopumilus sp.]